MVVVRIPLTVKKLDRYCKALNAPLAAVALALFVFDAVLGSIVCYSRVPGALSAETLSGGAPFDASPSP